MIDQATIDRLIGEFVDDVNEGKSPRIWSHLDKHPEDADKLLPAMNLIGTIRASTITVTSQEKEVIRERILRKLRG